MIECMKFYLCRIIIFYYYFIDRKGFLTIFNNNNTIYPLKFFEKKSILQKISINSITLGATTVSLLNI